MGTAATTFVTVLSGVCVFVIGQFVLKLIVDPIAAFRQRIGSIAYLVLHYQARLVNASNKDDDVRNEFRRHAAELIVARSQVPLYRVAAVIFRLPREDDVAKAARELNGLAFNIGPVQEDRRHQAAIENVYALKKLGQLLRIKTNYG